MTIRISTGARNCMLGDGSHQGLRAGFAAGFLYLYDGTQPATADTGATGNLLGKVTLNGDGTTGLTFDAAASGVLSKAAAETWKFTGLLAGTVGWYRFSAAGDTPTNTSTTAIRVDGLIATAGGDANMSNTTVAVGAVNTVDSWSWTELAS